MLTKVDVSAAEVQIDYCEAMNDLLFEYQFFVMFNKDGEVFQVGFNYPGVGRYHMVHSMIDSIMHFKDVDIFPKDFANRFQTKLFRIANNKRLEQKRGGHY